MSKNNFGFSFVKKGYDVDEVERYIVNQKNECENSLSEQKQRIFELKEALLKSENSLKEYKEKSETVGKAIIQAVAKADEIEKIALIKYRQEIERLKAFHDKWMAYYNRILRKYPLNEDLSAASKFNNGMKKALYLEGQNEEVTETAKRLEKTFDDENARLEKKNGKLTVKIARKSEKNEKKADSVKKTLVENGFDPIARISKYLEDAANVDIETPSVSPETTQKHNKDVNIEEAAAKNSVDEYSDRSQLGFSFQEALNPKEDLEQIMRDLGLFSEE